MLRIVSGKLKGRKIQTLKDNPARPTLQKTRDAVFNVVGSRFDLKQMVIFDLFAGTGAMGFEGLSRGAKAAVFIEKDARLFKQLRKNAEGLEVLHCSTIFCSDTLKWFQRFHFDEIQGLFFVDPPYDDNQAQQVVARLQEIQPRIGDSLAIFETPNNRRLEYPESFEPIQQKKYGKTALEFYRI